MRIVHTPCTLTWIINTINYLRSGRLLGVGKIIATLCFVTTANALGTTKTRCWLITTSDTHAAESGILTKHENGFVIATSKELPNPRRFGTCFDVATTNWFSCFVCRHMRVNRIATNNAFLSSLECVWLPHNKASHQFPQHRY